MSAVLRQAAHRVASGVGQMVGSLSSKCSSTFQIQAARLGPPSHPTTGQQQQRQLSFLAGGVAGRAANSGSTSSSFSYSSRLSFPTSPSPSISPSGHCCPIQMKNQTLFPASFSFPAGPAVAQTRHYHTRAVLKRRCSACYFVRRRGRLYVECKSKARHKQMQIVKKRNIWRDDYSRGNLPQAVFWGHFKRNAELRMGDNQFSRHNWLEGKIGVTV